jgi:hypothetical protein
MSDELHDVLKREVAAAVTAASGARKTVSRRRLLRVMRLSRLVALSDQLGRRPRKRWPVAALFVGTLSIASLLLFARVRETEIELHLSVSEVSFGLREPQTLIATLNLASLGASQFETTDFAPAARDRLGLPATSAGGELAGRITLTDLLLPAHTRPRLRHGGQPWHHRLSFVAPNVSVDASATGTIRVATPDAPTRSITLAAPQAAHFKTGAREAILDVTLADAPAWLPPALLVDQLSMTRIDELVGLKHDVVREVSTVLSGAIYLAALDDQEHPLRRADFLTLTAPAGELRSVVLGADHIDLEFRGSVRDILLGEGPNRRSLMPTWLEWIRARQGVALVWGSGLYLFGLVAGLRRWWRG